MEPPLTSLEYAAWLIYADWIAEQERRNNHKKRDKTEKWARRIGRALQKMYVAGVDPKCALAFNYGRHMTDNLHVVCGQYRLSRPAPVTMSGYAMGRWAEGKEEDVFIHPTRRMMPIRTLFRSAPGDCIFMESELFWLTPRELKRQCSGRQLLDFSRLRLYEPMDIFQPHLHRRLLMKFWRVVVRRASGIPASVLG